MMTALDRILVGFAVVLLAVALALVLDGTMAPMSL